MGIEPLPNERGLDDLDEATQLAEQEISRCLLNVLGDGSPLVRAELATGMDLLTIETVFQGLVSRIKFADLVQAAYNYVSIGVCRTYELDST